MAENVEKIYNRADIVAFIGKELDVNTFYRMIGFTDMGETLNTETYERRYVDEQSSRKDTTGFSKEISYAFDRYSNNEIHDMLAQVHDDELVGIVKPIVVVNFNKKNEDGSYEARKRNYGIIPDAQGSGTDAYTYSGTFGANGNIEKGKAVVSEDGKSCTFTAEL